jgi:hypothetical protein
MPRASGPLSSRHTTAASASSGTAVRASSKASPPELIQSRTAGGNAPGTSQTSWRVPPSSGCTAGAMLTGDAEADVGSVPGVVEREACHATPAARR